MQLPRALALALAAAVVVPTVAIASDTATTTEPRKEGRRFAEGGGFGARGQGERGERGERAAKRSPEERAQLRTRVQGKLQEYVATELAQRAGLDDKKKGQLADVIKARGERRKAAHESRKSAHDKLRQLVEQKAGDGQLKAQMKAVIDAGDDNERGALLEETARFLTPLEQAKVMLALPDVMKEAQHLMKEARGKRGRRGFGREGREGGLAD